MSELDKLRDRLGRDLANNNAVTDDMRVFLQSIFEQGFDAAASHLTDRLKEAEEIIQFYADAKDTGMGEPAINSGDFAKLGDRARAYLQKHKQPDRA